MTTTTFFHVRMIGHAQGGSTMTFCGAPVTEWDAAPTYVAEPFESRGELHMPCATCVNRAKAALHNQSRQPRPIGDLTRVATCPTWFPKVGDGATVVGYSDSQAHTVIDVQRNGKLVVLQRDKATLLNGANSGEPDALTFTPGGFVGHTSGTQRYRIERDPDGAIVRATMRTRRDGTVIWKQVGWPTKSPGGRVLLGERDEYYDFNF